MESGKTPITHPKQYHLPNAMDFIAKPVQKLSWLSGDVPCLQTPELSAWFWETACEAERVGGGKAEKGKPAESK